MFRATDMLMDQAQLLRGFIKSLIFSFIKGFIKSFPGSGIIKIAHTHTHAHAHTKPDVIARVRLVESQAVILGASELFSVAQLRIPIPVVFWERKAVVLIDLQEVANGTLGELPAIAFHALSAMFIAASRITCFLNRPRPIVAIRRTLICRVEIAGLESSTFPPEETL